jgi:chemotaxis protein MotB
MSKKAASSAIPPWVVTFADLMSLLLAFFVLLFSFSELDKAKYKQVAGSLRDAFGVQQEIRVKDPPKGINIIAREFSPGIPQPTTLNEVRQFTTSDSLPYPVLSETKNGGANRPFGRIGGQQADRERLAMALRPEIEAGLVELEIEEHRTIVRIKEKGAFPSGSDRLERDFEPIIRRLGDTLIDTSGTIVVAGHTDSVPIDSQVFRSNWDLSIARALTVARVFFDRSETLEPRAHLEAYGELRPIDSNETPEGRARNRRVEVSLVYAAPSADPAEGGQDRPSGPSEVAPGTTHSATPAPNGATLADPQPGVIQ